MILRILYLLVSVYDLGRSRPSAFRFCIACDGFGCAWLVTEMNCLSFLNLYGAFGLQAQGCCDGTAFSQRRGGLGAGGYQMIEKAGAIRAFAISHFCS